MNSSFKVSITFIPTPFVPFVLAKRFQSPTQNKLNRNPIGEIKQRMKMRNNTKREQTAKVMCKPSESFSGISMNSSNALNPFKYKQESFKSHHHPNASFHNKWKFTLTTFGFLIMESPLQMLSGFEFDLMFGSKILKFYCAFGYSNLTEQINYLMNLNYSAIC